LLRLPPPMWAMIFLGLTAIASWLAGWPPIPFVPHHGALGMILFFGGWILPVWAFRAFRVAGTEIDPISETNAALVIKGPYGLTRNPMYLGLTIAALGMAIWVGAWPMLLAPVAVFVTAALVHIPFEEAKMRRQYGEAYDAYCVRVRRWV
jgi:protein-S-isoprenylcysteine O-methyltransferase Ste14